ncbi:stage II sporulation protein E [Desulfovirgula thermocuniculi]|uniref:stage II sporulation protein E n=1 Tax=Desulfovirgula thermocuniculi TaxID=348842 RepID=UPI000423CCFA|nr:stage II sporulation protein E [Desulfovirgula thermocuniculi]
MRQEMEEVYPYRRVEQGAKKARKTAPAPSWQDLLRGRVFTGRSFLLFGAGFFLGRAVLLGEVAPLPFAFVAAAARVFPAGSLAALLGSCAGLATVKSGLSLAASLATAFFTWLLVQAVPAGLRRPHLVLPALVFALTAVVKAGLLSFADATPYQYAAVLFEGGFASLCTLVFLQALPSLPKLAGLAPLTAEELFAVVVLLLGVVAGTSELHVGMVSVKGVLSRAVILVGALLGGLGLGAAAGAVVGVVPGLVYTAVPAMVGVYSFAGLLAGLCRGLGRAGVALGFCLGNVILSFYLADFGHLAAVTAETALAIFLFFLLPGRLVGSLSRSLVDVFLGTSEGAAVAGRWRAAAERRLRRWSSLFHDLSRRLEEVPAREEPSAGLQVLFGEIAAKVCRGCGLYRTCWEWDAFHTYRNMLELLTQAELYGHLDTADLPPAIKKRCCRPKELAINAACLYDAYKLNHFWQKKLAESRLVVAEQLKSVAEMVEGLAAELDLGAGNPPQDGQYLLRRLKEAGLPVADLRFAGGREREIVVTGRWCERREICRELAAQVSRLTGENFDLSFKGCPFWLPRDPCTVRLYTGLKFSLEVGVAAAARGGSAVSGDSYAFLQLPEGRCALVISDGMGSGPEAARQSGEVVSLLERLLEAGLDWPLAVKTLNALMILRSPGDSFATLDMAILDLAAGQGEFIKIGAPPSFLWRNKKVTAVRAASLPVGVLRDLEVASQHRALCAGDVLVMASDGVLEAGGGAGDEEGWLAGVLRDVGNLSPQEMADLLLQLARARAGEGKGDDMTVVVARLQKV